MPNISFTYLIHLHYSYPFVNSSISFLLLTPKSMITMHSLRRCLLIQLIEMMSKLKCGFVVAVTVICPTATVGYLHHANLHFSMEVLFPWWSFFVEKSFSRQWEQALFVISKPSLAIYSLVPSDEKWLLCINIYFLAFPLYILSSHYSQFMTRIDHHEEATFAQTCIHCPLDSLTNQPMILGFEYSIVGSSVTLVIWLKSES